MANNKITFVFFLIHNKNYGKTVTDARKPTVNGFDVTRCVSKCSWRVAYT